MNRKEVRGFLKYFECACA